MGGNRWKHPLVLMPDGSVDTLSKRGDMCRAPERGYCFQGPAFDGWERERRTTPGGGHPIWCPVRDDSCRWARAKGEGWGFKGGGWVNAVGWRWI
ncbi:hypothetical protein Zmor_022170 [Zophobas morio]|uniref:Uncharacterized protein n=1 Tax=Zophobas morio TaxID=2755281 RepID=A0AA38M6H8_9CUCU|nr:hypothetical protein Zmor_022170 [Zophobas morio]